METAPTGTAPLTDRIKLPLRYDVDKMVAEVTSHNFPDFIYYSSIPLTYPIRKPDLGDNVDFADGSWADWNDAKELQECPYINSIVEEFRSHCDVTLVRLLRLEQGAIIKEHTDPTLGLHIEKSVIRLTIPIISDEGVVFYLNNTPVPMKPGECWYLNLTDPHKIINSSPTVRINMSIDMRPNDWVRNLILNSVN